MKINQNEEEKRGNFKFLSPDEQDKIVLQVIDKAYKRNKTEGKNNWGCKWTDEAIAIRRQVIIEYLAQGLGHYRTAQELQNRWQVAYKTAAGYIKDAVEYMGTNIAEINQYNYEIAVQRLESILEDALADKNRKEALQTIDLLNKIQGLYVNKVEADVKADTTIEFKFGGE